MGYLSDQLLADKRRCRHFMRIRFSGVARKIRFAQVLTSGNDSVFGRLSPALSYAGFAPGILVRTLRKPAHFDRFSRSNRFLTKRTGRRRQAASMPVLSEGGARRFHPFRQAFVRKEWEVTFVVLW